MGGVGDVIIDISARADISGQFTMLSRLHVSYLLKRQVIGKGALHVIIFTGGVHVVGADL